MQFNMTNNQVRGAKYFCHIYYICPKQYFRHIVCPIYFTQICTAAIFGKMISPTYKQGINSEITKVESGQCKGFQRLLFIDMNHHAKSDKNTKMTVKQWLIQKRFHKTLILLELSSTPNLHHCRCRQMSTLILPSSFFTSDTWLWGRGGPLCCSEASPSKSFSFLFVLCVIFVCSEKEVCLMNNMRLKKSLVFLHLRQIQSWTALHVIIVMLCKGKQVQSFVESS